MKLAYDRPKFTGLRRNRGFTLIETLVVLGLSLVIMSVGTGYVVRHTEGLANDAAGEHLKSVASAARDYARDNEDAISAALAGSPTAEVSIPMLKAQGYLPPSIAEANNYGQSYLVRFATTPAGDVEGLVVTQGGDAIKGLSKRKIAQSLGAAGGFLDEVTMTRLSGAYGAWERPLSDFGIAAGEAELAYALFVDKAVNKGSLADQYLSRRAIPGMPQLNRMEADLDMDGNAITGAGHLESQSAWVSSLEVEALTTGTLSVTGDALFSGGRAVFQVSDERNGPLVERTTNSVNATIEYRTRSGGMFAGAANQNLFAIGRSFDLSNPANRWFEVGPSGASVGGADVWTSATFDSDSKAEVVHEHSASDVSSGVFATARIPNLDASKINSGVLAAARIPNLDAGKVTTGTLNLARIPALPISKTSGLQGALDSKSAVGHAHSASDIVSGTLNADRIPTLPISRTSGLQAALDGKAASSHNHDASNITSGVLNAARIPNLNASKITAGSLHVNRIPALPISKVTDLQAALDSKAASSHNHDASDIASGVLNAARIPNLNASKITAGTFHVNRIPALPISQVTGLQTALDGKAASSHTHAAGDITSGVLNAARIPNLNASKITAGAFHVDRIPTLPISKVNGLQAALDGKANVSHAHSASDITSGTLHVNRIPALPISKVTGLQAALDSKAASSHTHAAGDITSGTLNTARIPNLNASKITAGAFHPDRIPSLSAAKITTGTLNAARIPNLNASKITAGAFHVNRIPTLPISKVSGLQAALDGKLNLSGGTMSGALNVATSSGVQLGLARTNSTVNSLMSFQTTSGTIYAGYGNSGAAGFSVGGSSNLTGANTWFKAANGAAYVYQGSTAREVWHAGNFDPNSKANTSHTHAAGDITSGTFNSARIPNLNASKITAGTFSADRIPNLNASKITGGTFNAARIPNLDASKITSGTLHANRIPSLPQSKITGLNDALDSKLSLSGGTLTGALTATRFRPTQTASCNATCSGNGWLARTSNGALLSCESGRWRGYSCGTGGGTQPGGCPGPPPFGCQPHFPSGWICDGGEIRQCI